MVGIHVGVRACVRHGIEPASAGLGSVSVSVSVTVSPGPLMCATGILRIRISIRSRA